MNTTLHHHNRNFPYMSEHKTTFVTGNCGYREVMNIMIVDLCFYLKSVRIISKTGAKN